MKLWVANSPWDDTGRHFIEAPSQKGLNKLLLFYSL